MVLVLAFLLLVSLVISAALAMLSAMRAESWRSAVALATASSLISFGVIACMCSHLQDPAGRTADVRDVWIGAASRRGCSAGEICDRLYLGNSGVASSFVPRFIDRVAAMGVYSAQIFFLGAAFTRQTHCGSAAAA